MLQDRNLIREAEDFRQRIVAAKDEIHKVIVGTDGAIDSLFISLVAGGHFLIQGPPGTAKTKLMKAAARVFGLTFGRIQGNAGLTPDDIIGQYLRASGPESEFRGGLGFFPGTVLTSQVLLWDEANRTTPKTQAALLNAMEEYETVTAYGEIKQVPNPFILLATQNPKEVGSGIFPLTHANVDRFLLMDLTVNLSKEEEIAMILQDDSEPYVFNLEFKFGAEEVRRLRGLVKELYPSERSRRLAGFITSLCRATRPGSEEIKIAGRILTESGDELGLEEAIHAGAMQRAEKLLARCARADAFLRGADEVAPQHAANVAHRVLRHRFILTSVAEQEGITADMVVDHLLSHIPEMEGGHYGS